MTIPDLAVPLLLEACVDSVDSAIAAAQAGARRLELCANLVEGGCTPSLGTVELVCREVAIPVFAIVRPRGGDFLYSEFEFATMKRDIDHLKRAGIAGVAFGILTLDGSIDRERTRELVEHARPLATTFHRAFDMTRDPFEALETLIDLGIQRVLTSGQQSTASQGAALIHELRLRTGEHRANGGNGGNGGNSDERGRTPGRIVVMAGGGIDETNVCELIQQTGVAEIHVNATRTGESQMRFRNPQVRLGKLAPSTEFTSAADGADRIRACLRTGGNGGNGEN